MSPNDQVAIKRVVLAGMKIMYDEKTFPMFKAGMQKNMPMPDRLATEAAGLVKILQDRANGSIPRPVLVPAASLLMLEIAKFMDDAGMDKPTPQDIKAGYAKLKPLMAKAFPNTKSRMQAAKSSPAAPASAPPAAPPNMPQRPPQQPNRGLIQSAQGVA